MTELIATLSTGIVSFIATNIDDMLILTLLFSQINPFFRRRHIILGQYLGFGTIIAVSFLGILGHYLIPNDWLRLLGLLPIAIGLGQLIQSEDNNANNDEDSSYHFSDLLLPKTDWYQALVSPQTYGVAAITIANGSDNIGIYLPLFANTTLMYLPIIIGIFLVLVGVWCVVAYQLTRLPTIAALIRDYGSTFMPCLLICLGVFIVKENIFLTFLALLTSYLWLVFLSDRNLSEEPPKGKNS
jgi:cadmium resistance transport/sequestration family protein